MLNTNQLKGIVKWYADGEEYIFWTFAEPIKKYIIDYLKKRFPNKLIVRELNKIDLSIPEENLPIEIQATPVHHFFKDNKRANKISPKYSQFENDIIKQINQGIVYGVCWFFFDSELLRTMQNSVNRKGSSISINMDWFRKLMKDGKLKVFTVSYNGIIEEKQYKDFDFLSEISQTCSIAAKTDDAILNENKMKIYSNVANMYGFKQSEIDKFYEDWREYCKTSKIDTEKNDGFRSFLTKQKDERMKLYGSVLMAIGDLPAVNKLLCLKIFENNAKSHASILGIIDLEGGSKNGRNVATIFVNKSNVCQYFPGYIRNKEIWDKLKAHSLNHRQFENIVKNGINNYFWYEEKSEQKIDIINTNNECYNKDVEFKIEDKYKIITINIKDKTKQKNIEDAWNDN
jgi:uncharacterized FlaG/YvyC family protein